MRRNPIYVFKDQTSVGIYDVPLESMIQIIDSDGLGTPLFTQITGKSGLGGTSTIGDFLNTATNYLNLDRDTLSELEKVGSGWRLLGKDPANYVSVGLGAVDLSNSITPGNFGAKGETSFAVGTGTKATNTDSVAMGTCNVGTSTETIVEVGAGITNAPLNVFEIYKDGTATIPAATDALINSRGVGSITTQGYVQNRVAAEFPSKTTDDLAEGSANLYYTDTRDTTNFNTNIAMASIDALIDVDTTTVAPQTNEVLKYNGTKWIPAVDLHEVTSVNGKVGDVVLTTAEITEDASNKYYTAARFDLAFGTKTTDDLAEGANLYYTALRAEGVADTQIAAAPLSALADVSTAPATMGQVLKYNGTGWQPGTDEQGITDINGNIGVNGVVTMNINDIADVNVAGATAGEIINWDGSEWVNVAPVDTITTVEDVLTSTSAVNALSANMGKALDDKSTINAANIATNLATIGGHSTDIGTNASNIATNVTDIATNVTAIGLNTAHSTAVTGNPHGVTKADVSLTNVDDTSDAAKAAAGNVIGDAIALNTAKVSFDTKTATDAHVAVIAGNPHGVTKADVSLGNVDDTSDATKPVSTAQQTALDAKLDTGGATGIFTNTPGTSFTITYADGLITDIA